MKKLATSLLLLTTFGCAAQAKQSVPVLPAFPAPPVNLSRQPGEPMLPDLKCLQETSQPCRGDGSSAAPSNAT